MVTEGVGGGGLERPCYQLVVEVIPARIRSDGEGYGPGSPVVGNRNESYGYLVPFPSCPYVVSLLLSFGRTVLLTRLLI